MYPSLQRTHKQIYRQEIYSPQLTVFQQRISFYIILKSILHLYILANQVLSARNANEFGIAIVSFLGLCIVSEVHQRKQVKMNSRTLSRQGTKVILGNENFQEEQFIDQGQGPSALSYQLAQNTYIIDLFILQKTMYQLPKTPPGQASQADRLSLPVDNLFSAFLLLDESILQTC